MRFVDRQSDAPGAETGITEENKAKRDNDSEACSMMVEERRFSEAEVEFMAELKYGFSLSVQLNIGPAGLLRGSNGPPSYNIETYLNNML
jgi:hypothetical protein